MSPLIWNCRVRFRFGTCFPICVTVFVLLSFLGGRSCPSYLWSAELLVYHKLRSHLYWTTSSHKWNANCLIFQVSLLPHSFEIISQVPLGRFPYREGTFFSWICLFLIDLLNFVYGLTLCCCLSIGASVMPRKRLCA